MRAHRISIRTLETLYYFARLRKDHIVTVGDDAIGHIGLDTTSHSYMSSSSSCSSSLMNKEQDNEKVREQEALLNPNNAMLTNSLKKKLLRDRPTISAVFRKADSLLGRHADPILARERKVHSSSTRVVANSVVDMKIPQVLDSVSLTKASSLVSGATSSSARTSNDTLNNTISNSNQIPNNILVTTQFRNAIKTLPQHPINENPPLVDLRSFLRLFREDESRIYSDVINEMDIEIPRTEENNVIIPTSSLEL